ncbi:uncharacterized protein LOC134237958 [Saccostrea cucullata]|uniref:uncharacterized protein LOC134237958 n=1 Tax=Saccostrea cuccullata TaxID=36930 RepID=UPI002ED2E933
MVARSKKKRQKGPQTSTPVSSPSTVLVASIDDELPSLQSPFKREKRTSSPGQSLMKEDNEELPDIPLPMTSKDTDETTHTDDWTSDIENKMDEDDVLKDFEEMMQKKRDRQSVSIVVSHCKRTQLHEFAMLYLIMRM